MNESPRGRIKCFDLLRVIAIILVALVHSMDASHSPAFNSILDLFHPAAVPLFVMVSGALILRKPLPLRTFFANRLSNMLLPFAFWSLVYTTISFSRGSLPSIWRFFPNFLTGNVHGIYWFMYMLFGLYLLAPFLARFVSQATDSEHRYVFFLFSGMYLLECLVSSIAFKIPITEKYLALFYAGHFLSKHRPALATKWWAILTIFWVTAQFALKARFSYHIHDDVFSYILSLLLFCTIGSSEVHLHGKRFSYPIEIVSKYSFGIYLIHFWFIYGLKTRGMYQLDLPSFLLVPLIAFTSLSLSFALLAVINKIPYSSRLIGVR